MEGRKSMSHETVCSELNRIYKAKQHDYGNSFGESVKEWGLIAAVIRMDDKMRRLKTLITSERQVDETIRDTLLDLANYSIMAVMELEDE
jgi:hypothetical protein